MRIGRSTCLLTLKTMVLIWLFSACASEDKVAKSSAPPLGPLAQAFASSASKHRIPTNILLALAYKESGLNAQPSRTVYDGSELHRGPSLAETMMGLSFATLGLNEQAAGDAKIQLDTYGAWVQKRLANQHLQLPATISKNDDLYDWIWQLAQMHHEDMSASKNLQIIFALELLDILNQGFIWQDPNTLERIELAAVLPKLEPKSFSAPIQANLQLDTRTSELFFVDYLQLTFGIPATIENHPKKILVTHCPLSLSSCLGNQFQLQSPGAIALQAHYLIPADDTVLRNPIKILQHKSPVMLTNAQGETQPISDAIVVMLVGDSGRYVNGQRQQSNPSWYTKEQLKNLGKIVNGVCQLMGKEDPQLNVQQCQTPGEGVEFAAAKAGAPYHFGEIPDFDTSIFWSFVRNPEDLSGKVTIQLPGTQKTFAAGSPVQVNFGFIKGTAKLEVQLLQRCPSGSTIWTTLQSHFIRNLDSKTIDVTLFDQGPNLNGQHFLRALAFDAKGKLMGWAVEDIFLSSYDKEGVPGPSEEQCKS